MSAQTIVQVALGEVGYLEKASNAYLNTPTANPGTANWTKYGEWYGLNPAEWCDMFVSWCAWKAGEDSAVGKYAYCPSHVQFFKSQGRWYPRGSAPRIGDIIFFGDADHVGIVESCSGDYIYTIEGNTRSGSTLVANGGGVFRKSYPLNSGYIMGYGRPAYGSNSITVDTGSVYVPDPVVEPELRVYDEWKKYKNGSTDEIVYADTAMTMATGSLNPYEECWCTGRYGNAYHVLYKVDGTDYTWKTGYVAYNGGVTD